MKKKRGSQGYGKSTRGKFLGRIGRSEYIKSRRTPNLRVGVNFGTEIRNLGNGVIRDIKKAERRVDYTKNQEPKLDAWGTSGRITERVGVLI